MKPRELPGVLRRPESGYGNFDPESQEGYRDHVEQLPWEKQQEFRRIGDFYRFMKLFKESGPRTSSNFLFAEMSEQHHSEQSETKRLRSDNSRLLLERERYKTELIHAKREARELLTRIEDVEKRRMAESVRSERQQDSLLKFIGQITEVNCHLQDALVERSAGRICMHEENMGVIARIIDDDIVVRYETGEGPLEQVYSRNQFLVGKPLQKGQRIEVHAFAWCRDYEPKGIGQYLSSEEIKLVLDAEKMAYSGPVDIGKP